MATSWRTMPTMCAPSSTPNVPATSFRRSASAATVVRATSRRAIRRAARRSSTSPLQLAEASGLELWRALSLSNRAQARFALGAIDEAAADLEQSREIFRSMGSRLESYPLGTSR